MVVVHVTFYLVNISFNAIQFTHWFYFVKMNILPSNIKSFHRRKNRAKGSLINNH